MELPCLVAGDQTIGQREVEDSDQIPTEMIDDGKRTIAAGVEECLHVKTIQLRQPQRRQLATDDVATKPLLGCSRG